MHLIKKMPGRLIREMRQAGAEKYNVEMDKYLRKVWYENPHNALDVIYVPFPAPAPTAFSPEIEEYAELFGLHSSPDGLSAAQCVNELIPHVLTTHARCASATVLRQDRRVRDQPPGRRRTLRS